jgi:transcriptional regulator with XRE-family HTH domain
MPRTAFREPLPAAAEATLQRLGGVIRTARLRRGWTQASLARKGGVAIMTLRNAEMGRPGVTLGTYVALLWALNLQHLLEPLLDPAADREGLALSAPRATARASGPRTLDDDF